MTEQKHYDAGGASRSDAGLDIDRKDAARYRWLRDRDDEPMSLREQYGHDIASGDIDKAIDEMMVKHCPEEWGPSDDRRLTCSCGNPDPGHMVSNA